MRVRGALVLLLLALLTSGAAAQQEAMPKVVVAIDPYASPLMPLAGVTALPLRITVDCALLTTAPPTATRVEIAVTATPAWLAATVSPASVFVPVSDCRGANVTLTSSLLVGPSADAPAFMPAEVRVSADVRSATPAVGEGVTLLMADFFSIIDVSGPDLYDGAPQQTTTCAITVSNFGNANTKVTFDVTEAPVGWNVQPPTPMTLEAKQQGGTKTVETVGLNVQPPSDITGGAVGAFRVEVRSHYAPDPAMVGDSGFQTCKVRIAERSSSTEAPLGWVAAPLAFALAAVFRASRQHP